MNDDETDDAIVAAAAWLGISTQEFIDNSHAIGEAVGIMTDEAIAANEARNARIRSWIETEETNP